MSNYTSGAGAIDALIANNESSSNMEFTSFKSGTTLNVKVLGTADLITFYSYGIFKVVNSFVAKNPSKKSKTGYPVDNLTPWDRAWLYHKDLSEEWTDAHGQEASKYRAKQRFAMGFIDLDTGKPIIVDVSRNQAQVIHGSIKANEAKLGRLSFKLAKQGEGTKTAVSLTPYVDVEMVDKLRAAEIDVEDDLTEAQRKHFDDAPEQFDVTLFDGMLFEADEDEQIRHLITAGFDVSLIGLEAPKASQDNIGPGSGEDASEIDDEDLPF